jgi:hypothetical protein
MNKMTIKLKTPLSQRVQNVARVIRMLTREEMAQLVSLVPQLREAQPIPDVEKRLASEYFQHEMLAWRNGKPPARDATFIGELTYEEYLALSEEEEIALWDKLFAEEGVDLDDVEEHDVRPAARVPPR